MTTLLLCAHNIASGHFRQGLSPRPSLSQSFHFNYVGGSGHKTKLEAHTCSCQSNILITHAIMALENTINVAYTKLGMELQDYQ